MWKRWKDSEFYQKMKQVRVNRAIYLSAVVILLSLAVVLAITAATNRAKRDDATDLPPTTTERPLPQTPPTTQAPDTSKPTAGTIPELALPVSGKLIKQHSVDVQVFSQTMQDWRVHLGVDIATAAGADVLSVADGSVAQIWEDPMMGWCVAIEHSGECVTVYKNLAKELAEGLAVGVTVKKGELLGHVGDTALLEIAEDPHLHLEMTVKGLQVDPLEYFSAAVLKSLSEDTIYEEELGK